MFNTQRIVRFLSLSIAVAGTVLVAGQFSETSGQQIRDPFAKPGWARERPKSAGGGSAASKPKSEVVNAGAPPIEQRIAFYKQVREQAVLNGRPIPRVTSVLTLNEMSVTGIFRTPRGMAAMVEALPIKLSYTIYPGEKFFDGQLVAVEENKLVFRKVTKMSNGKFVSAVENKPLRNFTDREQIQGTATAQTTAAAPAGPAASSPLVSHLDEMNRQTAAPAAEKAGDKPAKRPVRVARNRK